MGNRLTTKEFIKKAQKVHGDNYDYNLVEYVGTTTRVKIICNEHGEFEQTPRKHLSGNGCPLCGMTKRRITHEQFILKAKEKHGNKFDYSETEFIHYRIEIKIICPEHGEFYQLPLTHLNSHGCPQCAKLIKFSTKKHTTKTIIEKFIEVHEDRFDYSLVDYINVDTNVKIICREHGVFEQMPYLHLKGQGCRICSNKTYTKEIFISKSNEIHNNKYCYDLVKFINGQTSVEIICNKHGIFCKIPWKHMNGFGCPECFIESRKLPQEELINRFINIHGDKYDYSKVEYRGMSEKIEIICSIHGSFLQSPSHHAEGCGCPKCCCTNKSKIADEWLKSLNIEGLKPEFPIITKSGFRYIVDGYDPLTKIIYEFLGNFWHGNPEFYKAEDINPKNGISFGELYRQTIEKINNLQLDGYNVIYKWG
jgi:glutaredoxin